MGTAIPAMDTSCSVGIGDGLVVFGDVHAVARAQELYGRRDRRLDPGLPRNRRVEDARALLGMERINVGRRGVDETLTVTGNTDAMTRMQAIHLADARRRGPARVAMAARFVSAR